MRKPPAFTIEDKRRTDHCGPKDGGATCDREHGRTNARVFGGDKETLVIGVRQVDHASKPSIPRTP